jgi:hypothetical protein
MPRMRITDLGRQRLYLTRHMWASDDEAEIEPACVDAARAMGYVEDIEPEPAVAPRRRGRPPGRKAAPAATSGLEDKTVPELREMAEEKGVELPAGYVRHDDLVDIVKDAETDQGDEQPKSDD